MVKYARGAFEEKPHVDAGVAQLAERHLPKVKVESSNLFARFFSSTEIGGVSSLQLIDLLPVGCCCSGIRLICE